MITEDYVSFETAKLLKEKGFHEKVNHVYHYYNTAPFYHRHLRDFNGEDYKNLRHEHYSAPTLQMARKWLRKVHNIHIYPDVFCSPDACGFKVYGYNSNNRFIRLFISEYICNSYEEATDMAIKYCLEYLIE